MFAEKCLLKKVYSQCIIGVQFGQFLAVFQTKPLAISQVFVYWTEILEIAPVPVWC